MSFKKAEKKRADWFFVALIATVALLVIIIVLLLMRSCQEPEIPDYQPIHTEEDVVTLAPSDDKVEAPEGGGAVSLTYTKEATLNLTDLRVSMYCGNSSNSGQDIVISLYMSDVLIVQSGRLTAGNLVVSLPLQSGIVKLPEAGKYEGKYVIECYDPVSGEKANVVQEIPITVTVVE